MGPHSLGNCLYNDYSDTHLAMGPHEAAPNLFHKSDDFVSAHLSTPEEFKI